MLPQEIKDMQEAYQSFRAAHEKSLEEFAKVGRVTGDTQSALAKMQGVLDGLETKINGRMDVEEWKKNEKAMQERINDLEAKIARKGAFSGNPEDAKAGEKLLAKAAFFSALRWTPLGQKSLDETLGPDKMKALIQSNDTQGGYLAPLEYVNEILKDVIEYSNIRSICRVRSTTRSGIQIPKRLGTTSAAWVEETGLRTEMATPTFGMEELKTYELYSMVKVSKQELEDAAFDLEAFLKEEMSEQFGVAEADAFINGSSIGKPEGVMTNVQVTSVNSGDANLITADGLIGLYYDLKEVYVTNATWLMNRSSLKSIRQIKDGNGNYLWMPGISSDARPASILDRPYITAPEMPSVAPGAYPIVFGDFRRGYMILDRLVMEMMNDPFSSKSTGMVEFAARRRVGGKVIIAEALRKLRIAA